MNKKIISFHQICLVQRYSHYHFQINYFLKESNRAVDVLSPFFKEAFIKKNFQVKNIRVFYKLQLVLISTNF